MAPLFTFGDRIDRPFMVYLREKEIRHKTGLLHMGSIAIECV